MLVLDDSVRLGAEYEPWVEGCEDGVVLLMLELSADLLLLYEGREGIRGLL